MKTAALVTQVLSAVVVMLAAEESWAQAAGSQSAGSQSAGAKVRAEIAKDFAKGEFQQVIAKAEATLKRTTDATEVAELNVLKAQALLALGQPEKARAAFGAAVQKDPTVELDAAHASPDAVRLLERVRGELPATLVVLVKAGDDADVAVDDKSLGPAPLQTQVQGGVHVVLAKGVDGRTTRVEAQVPPGRKVVLELELRKPGTGGAQAHKVVPAPRDAPKVGESGKATSGGAAEGGASGQPGERSKAVMLEPMEATTTQPAPAVKPVVLGLWIGGGAAVVAGVVMLGAAGAQYDRLSNANQPALQPGEGEAIASTGQTLQTLGWVGVGVGLAAAATGGVLWWLDSRAESPRVGLAVTPGGAWVGVSGSFR